MSEWVEETPTRDGFYWMASSKNWIPAVVEVSSGRVYYTATDESDELPLHIDGLRWLGPLEAPK